MRANVIEAIRTVAGDRHKLVILLGEFGTGKTTILKDISGEVGGEYVNLNLHLAEQLLSIPRSRYGDGVTVHQLIDEFCDDLSPDGRPLMVDNVEILFSPELGKINPIDTFKRISRQRPVVLSLPARRRGVYAEYSLVGREDHLLMPLEEYVTIEMEEG
jgi:hypothetical protein